MSTRCNSCSQHGHHRHTHQEYLFHSARNTVRGPYQFQPATAPAIRPATVPVFTFVPMFQPVAPSIPPSLPTLQPCGRSTGNDQELMEWEASEEQPLLNIGRRREEQPPSRHSVGRMNKSREFCNALLWMDERAVGGESTARFNLCCLQDKVETPPLSPTPLSIAELVALSCCCGILTPPMAFAMRYVIEAKIATGINIGASVLIPCIALTPSEADSPFPLKRTQFPIRLAFAMTINKAQGQTFENVGVYLPSPVFTHGLLYVAMSRVRTPSAIKILIGPQTASVPDEAGTFARNVVYQEALL